MAILSIVIFGTALATASYAMWATVSPEFARIVDLLANGPVATPMMAAPVLARSSLRNVTVRSMSTTSRSPQRAAA